MAPRSSPTLAAALLGALCCTQPARGAHSGSAAPLPPGDLQLVLLEDAATRYGAVSLDGSPAGYYIRRGAEARKWIVHQTGGEKGC